jgi:hypothetical protein
MVIAVAHTLIGKRVWFLSAEAMRLAMPVELQVRALRCDCRSSNFGAVYCFVAQSFNLQSSESGWWTRSGGSRNGAVNLDMYRCLVLGSLLLFLMVGIRE